MTAIPGLFIGYGIAITFIKFGVWGFVPLTVAVAYFVWAFWRTRGDDAFR